MQLHLLFRCCQVLFCFVLFVVVVGGGGGGGAAAAAVLLLLLLLLLLLPLFFDRVSPIHISGEDILLKDQKKKKKRLTDGVIDFLQVWVLLLEQQQKTSEISMPKVCMVIYKKTFVYAVLAQFYRMNKKIILTQYYS